MQQHDIISQAQRQQVIEVFRLVNDDAVDLRQRADGGSRYPAFHQQRQVECIQHHHARPCWLSAASWAQQASDKGKLSWA